MSTPPTTTDPVPCGACGETPDRSSYAATSEGDDGEQVKCPCGVRGPIVVGAQDLAGCTPAWNAMWDRPRIADATKAAARNSASLLLDIFKPVPDQGVVAMKYGDHIFAVIEASVIRSVLRFAAASEDEARKAIESSLALVAEPKVGEATKTKAKLDIDSMVYLKDGWNGYDAERPSGLAALLAQAYIERMHPGGKLRVAPSAVGGVGVTQKADGRKVYVDFYNNGEVYALFSDGLTDPRAAKYGVSPRDFVELATEAAEYLGLSTSALRECGMEGEGR